MKFGSSLTFSSNVIWATIAAAFLYASAQSPFPVAFAMDSQLVYRKKKWCWTHTGRIDRLGLAIEVSISDILLCMTYTIQRWDYQGNPNVLSGPHGCSLCWIIPVSSTMVCSNYRIASESLEWWTQAFYIHFPFYSKSLNHTPQSLTYDAILRPFKPQANWSAIQLPC